MDMTVVLGIFTLMFFITLSLMSFYRTKIKVKLCNILFIIADFLAYSCWNYAAYQKGWLDEGWLTLGNISPLMFTVILLTPFMNDKVKDYAFSLACKDTFTIPVKLPLYFLCSSFLLFTEVPEIATKHSACIWSKLLEVFKLFRNKRNVTLFPCPHNNSVKRNIPLGSGASCRCALLDGWSRGGGCDSTAGV